MGSMNGFLLAAVLALLQAPAPAPAPVPHPAPGNPVAVISTTVGEITVELF